MGQVAVGGIPPALPAIIEAIGHVVVMYVGIITTNNFILDPIEADILVLRQEGELLRQEKQALKVEYEAYIRLLKVSLSISLSIVCALSLTMAAPSFLWTLGYRRQGVANGTLAARLRNFAQQNNIRVLLVVTLCLDFMGRNRVHVLVKLIIGILMASLFHVVITWSRLTNYP